MIQAALIGRRYKLLQVPSFSQFCIQPQEGAVHFFTAPQALLRPPDCPEKVSQEEQVMMKCVSVLLPEHLQFPALVCLIKLGFEALAQTRLYVRVKADDFSGVHLTFTVGADIDLLDSRVEFSREEPLFTKSTLLVEIYSTHLEFVLLSKMFFPHMNRSLASEKPCR